MGPFAPYFLLKFLVIWTRRTTARPEWFLGARHPSQREIGGRHGTEWPLGALLTLFGSTTLYEAILEHGAEAARVRSRFTSLPHRDAAAIIRFLESLVLFFPENAP